MLTFQILNVFYLTHMTEGVYLCWESSTETRLWASDDSMGMKQSSVHTWPLESAPTPFSLLGKQQGRKCNSVFLFNIILIFVLCIISFFLCFWRILPKLLFEKNLRKGFVCLFSTGKDSPDLLMGLFKNVKKTKLLKRGCLSKGDI